MKSAAAYAELKRAFNQGHDMGGSDQDRCDAFLDWWFSPDATAARAQALERLAARKHGGG